MRGAIALSLALLGIAAAGVAQVALPDSGPRGLAEERQALTAARRQAQVARERSRQLQEQARKATLEADKTSRAAAALAARIQESEADIQAAQARIAIVGRLQRAQAAKLAERQKPIVRLTAALQTMARRPAALALVRPGSVIDAVHMRMVLGTVLPVIRERTADLRAELARSRQLRAAAEQATASMRSSREQLAARQKALGRLEAQQRLTSRDLSSGANLEGERALALGERARDIVDLMDKLEVAGYVRQSLATLSGPLLRPAQPGAAGLPAAEQPVAAGASPTYRMPVVGALVTGMGELAESGIRARGLTIETQPGAQAVAPSQGRVAFAGPYRGYGQIVIVDHGQGWTTLITGLHRLSVAVGADVRQGDPLGVAPGGKARVTVELRRNGRPVDIVPLLAG